MCAGIVARKPDLKLILEGFVICWLLVSVRGYDRCDRGKQHL